MQQLVPTLLDQLLLAKTLSVWTLTRTLAVVILINSYLQRGLAKIVLSIAHPALT